MGESVSISITPENQAEILQAAADAVAGANPAVATAPPVSTEPETTPSPEAAAETPESLEIPTDETPQSPEDALPGFDLTPFYEEFNATGDVSSESSAKIVEALTKAGFKGAEDLLTQYVVGAKATRAEGERTINALVGGPEQYKSMIEWTKTNLSQAEKVAFNNAIRDPALAEMTVRGLHAKYRAASGNKPSPRVAPGANALQGLAPITSIEQIAALTGDKRFDTDPAFRSQVEARIQASMAAGLI